MSVSVLLISYNGEKYIQRQIETIVCQLNNEDELIVSDDGSVDNTIFIIKQLQNKYQNIKLVYGKHEGFSANINNAYMYAKGDIICFCDQDDIWKSNKIDVIKTTFKKNPAIDVILHDAQVCDKDENLLPDTLFFIRKARHGVISNWIKSTYYGCCMCFRDSFLKRYMPLPKKVILYDQYLGLKAEYKKKSLFLNMPLIVHRYHGNNFSYKRGWGERILFRMSLLWQTLLN